MAAFRLSMIFRCLTGPAALGPGNRSGSWSESVYWSDLSDSTRRAFNALCLARANLLGQGCVIVGQRFQPVDPPGAAQTRAVNYPAPVTTDTLRDQPNSAVRISVRGSGVANVARRRLAGVPDPQISNGEFNPTGLYRASLTIFLRGLNGWQFRGADLTVQKVQVKTIDATGLVETVTDLPVVTGNVVRLYKVDLGGGKFKSGSFVVQEALTVRTFRLRGWTAGAATQGQVRKYSPIYPVITGADESNVEATVRKIGRPFASFRGRRSPKRT